MRLPNVRGAKICKGPRQIQMPAGLSSTLAKGLSKPKRERVDQRGQPPGTHVPAKVYPQQQNRWGGI